MQLEVFMARTVQLLQNIRPLAGARIQLVKQEWCVPVYKSALVVEFPGTWEPFNKREWEKLAVRIGQLTGLPVSSSLWPRPHRAQMQRAAVLARAPTG